MDVIAEQMKSAEYMSGELVIDVPVTWILHNLRESCDMGNIDGPEDWLHMMEYKANDTGFGHLVESIMARGFLKNGSIGLSVYPEGAYINEGHHRLVAAVLLCVDTIPASRYGASHYRDKSLPQLSAHHSEDEYPIEF